jgi:cytochrome b
MLLLMLTLAVTGLVRAATDLYYPPFGTLAAYYVAETGADPAAIQPYDAVGTDPRRMAELKAFKGPFGQVHKYAAYTLMVIILIHIVFVVRAELTEGGGIISAMFTGNKVTDRPPVDI